MMIGDKKGKCIRGHGMVTRTFKAVNMWQPLFSPNSLILKLSWKGPGIGVIIQPVTWGST